jgi:hypothetical protein
MSNSALVNLATVGSDELQAMPISAFTAGLEQMSAEGIVRFRRLRKLSGPQRSALEKFLVEHPDKRPGGGGGEPGAPARHADEEGEKNKKKKSREAGIGWEILLRVIAWWEGMETDDVARAKGIKRRQKRKVAPPATARNQAAPAAAPAAAPEPPISMSRLEIIQKLWGPGFSLPGGADFALLVAERAGLKSKGRFLDLAPGLGGGMRAVATKHGITIVGIEADAEVAAEALRLATEQGMGETAPVRACGPEGLKPADFEPAEGHAAIFMRESMFAVDDRETMLAEINHGLAESGSLILTDFILATGIGVDTEEAPALAAWRMAEGGSAAPWTEAEYRRALEAQNYKLESFEDLTLAYLPLIQSGWRQLHDCLQKAKLLPETATTLMEEGAVWLARCQALETKQLRLVLIHATRTSTGSGANAEADFASEDADEANG